jgi:predicted ATPase/DNA-binding XRE family transcriptional regulator
VSPEQEETAFGARLRRLREFAGLTQEELASRAGLTPNAVSALERGLRKRPYPHTVRSLSDALELSEEERATLLAAVPRRSEAAPSAAEEERPPTSLASVVSALPHPAAPLVGRERETEEVRGLLARPDVRLVTLTGIGGVGKTRLAVEIAREVAPLFPDGLTFLELAPLADPSLVVPTVLRSLHLPEPQGRTPREAVIDHLRDRIFLLVLDNLEHLVEAAPEVAALVEACPGLVVLATSRAPLRIRGEIEYPVPLLALPASTRSPEVEEVLASPSGMLFAERARAASPDFAITRENAAAVAAICWRLAGLPLALELAAAKARFLDPATLLSRLDRALSTAWARDLPERQRTMRATLDWSYNLLGGPARILLRRLSIFVGGFSMEAAEAVGGEGDAGEVLDLLGTLAEQSLVTVDSDAGSEARYGMLEPVRQYASEKLEESGEEEDARLEHAGFFLTLAERAAPELLGLGQVAWLDRLERESGNLRAAISRSLDAGEPETAARFGWALLTFWWIRGYHREGRRFMEAALEGSLPPALRIEALQVAGSMAYVQGDYPASEERFREAILLAREEENPFGEGYARLGLGLVHMGRSEHETATSEMEGALALFERCAADYLVSVSRVWLGTALLAQGESSERAEQMFEEGLAWVRRVQNPSFTYVVLYNLAQLALSRGDLEAASSMLGEGIELSGQTKDRANLAYFLQALSAVEAFREEVKRSAVLIGAAEGSLREVGAPVYNFYRPDPSVGELAVDEARAVLGDAAFEEARERGRMMTFEQAVAYALEGDEASPT